MALSYREVAEILKIIDASECEEVTLELEGVRLSVRRGGAAAVAEPSVPVRKATGQGAVPATADATTQMSGPALPDGTAAIRAPMIGTFYRRPEPGKAPFVEIGSSVQPGDPVCLIEVMKLFTTIEATEVGTIREIAAQDAAMVEFDQVLFVIDPV